MVYMIIALIIGFGIVFLAAFFDHEGFGKVRLCYGFCSLFLFRYNNLTKNTHDLSRWEWSDELWCILKRYKKKRRDSDMRSHKYQAKCLNPKGKWVEGSLLIFSNDSAAIIPSGSVIFHPYEKSYQLVVKECVIVDPNTVSQATDYQDVYGNTIFENHILTDGILQILILWDRDKGGWMYETESGARYNFNRKRN